MKSNSPQISIDFGEDEIELIGYPISLESGVADISELLASLDPTGLYPNKKRLIEQIYLDAISFISISGTDSFPVELLKAIENELQVTATDLTTQGKKNAINDVRKKFPICESLRRETPKGCHAIVLLKIALLNAVIHNTHPLYICEGLARQIRQACRVGDCRSDLLSILSDTSEFELLKPDLFISWLVEASTKKSLHESNLVRRLTSFFTTISHFFGHEPSAKSSYPFFTQRQIIKSVSPQITDARSALSDMLTGYIDHFEIETTYRWLKNTLSRSVTCYSRLNKTERFELIANLNDLAESTDINNKWAALTLLLMYCTGKTIQEVNQLKIGEDLIVNDGVFLKRDLGVPEDAGQVAPAEICEQQAYSILLPLHEPIGNLVEELLEPNKTIQTLIGIDLKDQTKTIKKYLKAWRDFGRYDLKMPKIIAALATEISIQTQSTLIIFALASKPNHRFPTLSYYAGVSHQQMLAVWNEAQDNMCFP